MIQIKSIQELIYVIKEKAYYLLLDSVDKLLNKYNVPDRLKGRYYDFISNLMENIIPLIIKGYMKDAYDIALNAYKAIEFQELDETIKRILAIYTYTACVRAFENILYYGIFK